MKTLLELNALIPTIIKLLEKEEPEIGNYRELEYEDNTFCYEEDGWVIEIDYRCTGYWHIESDSYYGPGAYEVTRGWGEVDEIRAYHYDDATEEETEFDEKDLTDLYVAVNESLKELV